MGASDRCGDHRTFQSQLGMTDFLPKDDSEDGDGGSRTPRDKYQKDRILRLPPDVLAGLEVRSRVPYTQ
jgi:hypothetical protein